MPKPKSNKIFSLSKKIAYPLGILLIFLASLTFGYVSVKYGIIRNPSRRIPAKEETVLGKSTGQQPKVIKELPISFPKAFPIYKNSTLVDSWTAETDGVNGLSLVWENSDSFQGVFDFYQAQLEENGWNLDIVSKVETSGTISFEKEDNFGNDVCIQKETCSIAGFIGITEGEKGKVIISVTIGIKKEIQNL